MPMLTELLQSVPNDTAATLDVALKVGNDVFFFWQIMNNF